MASSLWRGDTPFVGRDQELGLLEDRLVQVYEGWGQGVLISGEAGIGKSRLMQAFRERIAERPHTWLECRCSPYAQDTSDRLLPMDPARTHEQEEELFDGYLDALLRGEEFEPGGPLLSVQRHQRDRRGWGLDHRWPDEVGRQVERRTGVLVHENHGGVGDSRFDEDVGQPGRWPRQQGDVCTSLVTDGVKRHVSVD